MSKNINFGFQILLTNYGIEAQTVSELGLERSPKNTKLHPQRASNAYQQTVELSPKRAIKILSYIHIGFQSLKNKCKIESQACLGIKPLVATFPGTPHCNLKGSRRVSKSHFSVSKRVT